MQYIFKRRNRVFNIIKLEKVDGYKFKSKSEKIKDLNVINDDLINKIVNKKINNMFIRLLMIVNDAYNSDDNPSGTAIALDEILMVKNSIKNKYAKYLEKEQSELYLRKLRYIEEEIKFKKYYVEDNHFIKEDPIVEEERKGRGR